MRQRPTALNGFLSGAGFDTRAMANFFETIGRRKVSPEPTSPRCSRYHPVTSVRIAEARARAAQLGPQKVKESLSYLVHPRAGTCCHVARGQDVEKYYAVRLAKNSNDLGTRYGEALALMADNRPWTPRRFSTS